VLAQAQYAPMRLADEIALIVALQEGLLDQVPLEAMPELRRELPRWLDHEAPLAVAAIARAGELDARARTALLSALSSLVSSFANNATSASGAG